VAKQEPPLVIEGPVIAVADVKFDNTFMTLFKIR